MLICYERVVMAMKISFSTLGCPDWTWKEIIATAKDFGYDGIEVRGIAKEMYVPNIKEFSEENIMETKEKLSNLNLEISCLTSASYIQKSEKYIDEAKEYIDKAVELSVPYVRVLGDSEPYPEDNVDEERVKNALIKLGKYAENKPVIVLIETNGVWANSKKLSYLLNDVDSSKIGVIWDIHHPYRFMQESMEETYDNLKGYIKHIHIKDSIVSDNNIVYKMMGEGDIPIVECLKLLKDDNYSGFISLEWVKRWYKNLEEPGVVFLEFVNYIKDIWNKL
jgi:sugar phosphate isomerase/epimerase